MSLYALTHEKDLPYRPLRHRVGLLEKPSSGLQVAGRMRTHSLREIFDAISTSSKAVVLGGCCPVISRLGRRSSTISGIPPERAVDLGPQDLPCSREEEQRQKLQPFRGDHGLPEHKDHEESAGRQGQDAHRTPTTLIKTSRAESATCWSIPGLTVFSLCHLRRCPGPAGARSVGRTEAAGAPSEEDLAGRSLQRQSPLQMVS